MIPLTRRFLSMPVYARTYGTNPFSQIPRNFKIKETKINADGSALMEINHGESTSFYKISKEEIDQAKLNYSNNETLWANIALIDRLAKKRWYSFFQGK